MSNVRRSAAHAAVTEHNMMVADLEEAQAAIQRVRELHAPIRVDLAGSERCGYCAILPWPCDTIRAIEGDSDD